MPDDSSIPSSSGQRAIIRLRPAEPDDLDPLERIEQAAFASDRIRRRRLRAHIGSPTADLAIAEIGGRPVGYCLVLSRRGSTVARLYSLAVDPLFAGRGIGQRLLAEAEDSAARRGAAKLRLEVRADNAAGLRLYEANGYVCIGRREEYYSDGKAALRFERLLRGDRAIQPERRSFRPAAAAA